MLNVYKIRCFWRYYDPPHGPPRRVFPECVREEAFIENERARKAEVDRFVTGLVRNWPDA